MEGRTQWCVTGFENQPNVNSVEGSTPLPSAKFWKVTQVWLKEDVETTM
jgi:hypothetical protein